jgi:hypothetical protein
MNTGSCRQAGMDIDAYSLQCRRSSGPGSRKWLRRWLLPGRPAASPAGWLCSCAAGGPAFNFHQQTEQGGKERTITHSAVVLFCYQGLSRLKKHSAKHQYACAFPVHTSFLHSLTHSARSALAAYYHDAATQSHQHRSINFHFSLWLASAKKNKGTRERLERHMHVYGTIDRLGICLLTDQWPAETSQLNSPGRSTNRHRCVIARDQQQGPGQCKQIKVLNSTHTQACIATKN